MRWDSDHVVLQNDDTMALMQEVVRANALSRVYIALDFFDASINRIAAWVIGTRATQKGAPVCAVGTAGKAARGGTRGRYDLPPGAGGKR